MTAKDILNFKGHQVRHVLIEGEPWFAAVDICRCLSLNISKGAAPQLYNLRPVEKWVLAKRRALEEPRLQQGSVAMLFGNAVSSLTLISESGLYKLIMRSDKPEAQAFQDWVTQEVLPTIRKTGGYQTVTHEAPPAPRALPGPDATAKPLAKLEPFQPLPGSIAQRLRALADEIEDLTRRLAA